MDKEQIGISADEAIAQGNGANHGGCMNGLVERPEFMSGIMSKLDRGVWCGIAGSRFSGKTVLARQLAAAIRREHKDWRVTLVEFKKRNGTLDDAWQQIESRINVGRKTGRSNALKGSLPADCLSSMLSQTDEILCLVLDNPRVFPDEVMQLLAGELKRLSQMHECRPKLRCVLLGGMKLLSLTRLPDSPLYGVVESVRLPDLTFEQTIASFEGVHGLGCLGERARDALFAETGGHPHLLRVLAELVGKNALAGTASFSEADVTASAESWSSRSARLKKPIDECFSDAVRFMEKHAEAYRVALSLVDTEATMASRPPEWAMMCGAFAGSTEDCRFRGRMFERAVRAYLDDIRKADYCCLHGQWERAHAYYARVSPKEIQMRRGIGFGCTKKRIMDLYLGLAPAYVGLGELQKAQETITQTSKHLFGADRAILWRIGRLTQQADVVSTTPDRDSPKGVDAKLVALAAAREDLPFTLVQNKGIIQGIRPEANKDRWALELQYEKGIPGQWVIDSLNYVEALFVTILNQASSREMDTQNSRNRQELLRDIGLELQKASEVRDVLKLIVDGVRDKLAFECAQLSLIYPHKREIRAVTSNGPYDPVNKMTVRDLDGSDILAEVIRTRRPAILDDCTKPGSRCDPEATKLSGLLSQLILPLIVGDEIIGTLQVGSTSRTGFFTEEHYDVLGPFADQAALSIRMAREREALESVLDSAGDAAVVVDASDNIEYCSNGYARMFGCKRGDGANLARTDTNAAISLVRQAFERKNPVQTLQDAKGQTNIITAVSRKDPFGRYDGGVELISRSKIYGLTTAFGRMLQIADENQLGQALVDCLCDNMGYSRARFYRMNDEKTRLTSRWSRGMPPIFADRFARGEFILNRPERSYPGDVFSCMQLGEPLIMVSQRHAEDGMETRKVAKDSQHRRVVVLPDEDRRYSAEIGTEDIEEWVNVPIGTASSPLGTVSVDKVDGSSETNHRFGHEDVEILSLFAKWASDAMALVLELKRAKENANTAFDVPLMGEQTSLEPLTWNFLINITIKGGPGFNRAALFVRRPQSEIIQGHSCQGAANKDEWEKSIRAMDSTAERGDIIDIVSREKAEGKSTQAEQERLDALRGLVVAHKSPTDVLWGAVALRKPILVVEPAAQLGYLYDALRWEVPHKAMVCPLMFRGDCEGLVYVDRAFMYQDITNEDQKILEKYCFNLASVLHRYRLDEQLRYLVLGRTHTWGVPFISIQQNAQSLRTLLKNKQQIAFIDKIVCEARRGRNLVRRVLQAGKIHSGKQNLMLSEVDIVKIAREAIHPYTFLMRQNKVSVRLHLPSRKVTCQADEELIGSVFAELAANAHSVLAGVGDGLKRTFSVSFQKQITEQGRRDPTMLVFLFQNSGRTIPSDIRSRMFEPFSSVKGSRGLGLWFVKEIVESHGGKVTYHETEAGLSQFTVFLREHKH